MERSVFISFPSSFNLFCKNLQAVFEPNSALDEPISDLILQRIQDETLPSELLQEIAGFCGSLEEPCVRKMLEDQRESA